MRIDPNGKQQVLLNTMVAELDRSAIENQGTNLALALSHAGVSLVSLPGAVATPFSGATAVTSPSGWSAQSVAAWNRAELLPVAAVSGPDLWGGGRE